MTTEVATVGATSIAPAFGVSIVTPEAPGAAAPMPMPPDPAVIVVVAATTHDAEQLAIRLQTALVDEPIQEHAAALLSQNGIDASGFAARQLDERLLAGAAGGLEDGIRTRQRQEGEDQGRRVQAGAAGGPVRTSPAFCLEDAQLIRSDIEQQGVDSVVIAACSLRLVRMMAAG